MARRVGVWLVGGWGGVATTVVTGLSALKRGLTDGTGLVSSIPPFANLDLVGFSELVLGGHEIRETTALAEAEVLNEKSRVFSPAMLSALKDDFAAFDKNMRPGTILESGKTIAALAGPAASKFARETPGQAIDRLTKDIAEFREREKLDQVIVINVSSTEPTPADEIHSVTWDQIEQTLAGRATMALPPSTLYAIAAFRNRCPFVNFTPSVGSDCPALKDFAIRQKTLHVGRDGKTGETLMKAVLAPMFAARNLRVMSWVGHNIFGNLDGKVLDDPVNKANKVKSKDHLLTEILGYKPQTLVSIEYIESMGDWKTAWDHIHFQGFLGTPMVLQFIWQGCDSLLAAPLVVDLIRLTERESRRGTSGVMSFLAGFFKSPMECDEPAFAYQFQQLLNWAQQIADDSAVS